MTDNGKNDLSRRGYRYNYILANMDRMRVLSFLKKGPRTWMDTFEMLDYDGKGNFAHLLDGMIGDLLVRTEYQAGAKDTMGRPQGVTLIHATNFGLEKLRQTQEEIAKL
jgi:hypothetical protein